MDTDKIFSLKPFTGNPETYKPDTTEEPALYQGEIEPSIVSTTATPDQWANSYINKFVPLENIPVKYRPYVKSEDVMRPVMKEADKSKLKVLSGILATAGVPILAGETIGAVAPVMENTISPYIGNVISKIHNSSVGKFITKLNNTKFVKDWVNPLLTISGTADAVDRNIKGKGVKQTYEAYDRGDFKEGLKGTGRDLLDIAMIASFPYSLVSYGRDLKNLKWERDVLDAKNEYDGIIRALEESKDNMKHNADFISNEVADLYNLKNSNKISELNEKLNKSLSKKFVNTQRQTLEEINHNINYNRSMVRRPKINPKVNFIDYFKKRDTWTDDELDFINSINVSGLTKDVKGNPNFYISLKRKEPISLYTGTRTGKYSIPILSAKDATKAFEGELIPESNKNLIKKIKIKINPENTYPQTIVTNDVAEETYDGPELNFKGLTELQKQTLENIEYLKKRIPSSKMKVFGSTQGMVDAGLPHIGSDYDVIMPKSEFDRLEKAGTFDGLKSSDLMTNGHLSGKSFYLEGADTWTGDPEKNPYKIDINFIEESPNGKGSIGERANELFLQLHPEEYSKEYIKSKQNGSSAIDIIPESPDQLIDEMDPSTKSIMDVFETKPFSYPSKNKQLERPFSYIAFADPQKVRLAIYSEAKRLNGIASEFIPSKTLPIESFANFNDNIKFLSDIEYPKEMGLELIAKDPERMKNLVDYWFITSNHSNRVLSDVRDISNLSPENFASEVNKRMYEKFDPHGGTASGIGTNMIYSEEAPYDPKVPYAIGANLTHITNSEEMKKLKNLDELKNYVWKKTGNPKILLDLKNKGNEILTEAGIQVGTRKTISQKDLLNSTAYKTLNDYKNGYKDIEDVSNQTGMTVFGSDSYDGLFRALWGSYTPKDYPIAMYSNVANGLEFNHRAKEIANKIGHKENNIDHISKKLNNTISDYNHIKYISPGYLYFYEWNPRNPINSPFNENKNIKSTFSKKIDPIVKDSDFNLNWIKDHLSDKIIKLDTHEAQSLLNKIASKYGAYHSWYSSMFDNTLTNRYLERISNWKETIKKFEPQAELNKKILENSKKQYFYNTGKNAPEDINETNITKKSWDLSDNIENIKKVFYSIAIPSALAYTIGTMIKKNRENYKDHRSIQKPTKEERQLSREKTNQYRKEFNKVEFGIGDHGNIYVYGSKLFDIKGNVKKEWLNRKVKISPAEARVLKDRGYTLTYMFKPNEVMIGNPDI